MRAEPNASSAEDATSLASCGLPGPAVVNDESSLAFVCISVAAGFVVAPSC